ncbi:hypothetical protein CANINC_003860 [Pichia inconspicua]|uniref:Enhancer of mRNA-decapping protein 3 n=1 Tax=Pichia inconspicua TaxID=52247 RepID=A0A4T0WZ46_9ASCO|nr:hypothetical protein CANINC_003860 [[Candida] inconspicua]
MSQFYGYTVDIELKQPDSRKIRGVIDSLDNTQIVLLNPTCIKDDGSFEDLSTDSIILKSVDIKDLNVIKLAKNKSKASKKQIKVVKQDESGSGNIKDEIHKNGKRSRNKRADNFSLDINSCSNSNTDKDLEVKYVDIYNGKQDENIHSNQKKRVELEEFDFASNLQKFDKASVFKEISQNDEVDQSCRLVSFNKVDPKVSVYNNDEMIVKQKKKESWDDNSNFNYSNITRKSDDVENLEKNKSTSVQNSPSTSRQASNTIFEKRTSLASTTAQFSSVSFGEQPVPTCSTLQLSEILNLCKSKLGLTEQIITENSGRNLSELFINNIIGGFRISQNNHNEPPLVLILAGNNRAGVIALTAGRHLFNRGVKVISFLLYDSKFSDDELLLEVDEELKRFSNIGGKIVNNVTQLVDVLNMSSESPLEFILEGLGGFESDLNDLIGRELELAIELIEWCNSSKLPIMSMDIPAGLNPSSGTNDNNEKLIIKSTHLASIGLPLSSALNIYKFGYFEKGKVKHYLIDSGIPRKVFGSKSNLRKFDRRWFAESSVIAMQVI